MKFGVSSAKTQRKLKKAVVQWWATDWSQECWSWDSDPYLFHQLCPWLYNLEQMDSSENRDSIIWPQRSLLILGILTSEPVLTVLSLFHDSFHPIPLNCLVYIIISIFFHIQFLMTKLMNREVKQIQNGKIRISTVAKALHIKIKYQWQGKSICWHKWDRYM